MYSGQYQFWIVKILDNNIELFRIVDCVDTVFAKIIKNVV